MIKSIECVVRGRVQGVGYRYFVSRKAKHLGILGNVRNDEDGSVKVQGEGEEDVLAEFIVYLRKGPIFAKVEDVQIEYGEQTKTFNDFRVIF